MRRFAPTLALVALATAAPQDLRFDDIPPAPVASIPLGDGVASTVVPYNPTSVIQETVASILSDPDADAPGSLEKRAGCAPIASGAGPVASPDTAQGFLDYATFASQSQNAAVPAGWTKVFTNLKGESQTSAYLGYTTLSSYDVASCAASCTKIKGCISFNVAYERTPTVNPGDGCQNPPSSTVIKCVFWGTVLSPGTATNTGQWRAQFQVVIAGSNGYVKTPSAADSAPGYDGTFLTQATIDAPQDCNGYYTNTTYKVFTDGAPYDVQRCAAVCDTETALSMQPSSGHTACRFFTTYISLKNGVPQGQVCVMYNETWSGTKYATNTGYTSGKDVYTIGYSQSYSNRSDPGLPICPSDIANLAGVPSNAAFCSAYISYTPPVTTATVTATVSTFTVTTSTSTTVSAAVVSPVTVTITSPPVTVTDPGTSTVSLQSTQYPTPPPARRRDVTGRAVSARRQPGVFEALRRWAGLEARVTATPAQQTPSQVAGWPSSKISAACSQVATGTVTSTVTGGTATVYTSTSVAVSVVTSTAAATGPATVTVYQTPTSTVWAHTETEIAIVRPNDCFRLVDPNGYYLSANTDDNVAAALSDSDGAMVFTVQPSSGHLLIMDGSMIGWTVGSQDVGRPYVVYAGRFPQEYYFITSSPLSCSTSGQGSSRTLTCTQSGGTAGTEAFSAIASEYGPNGHVVIADSSNADFAALNFQLEGARCGIQQDGE